MTAKRIVESLLLRTIGLRRGACRSRGAWRESIDDHRRLVRLRTARRALASAIMRSNHMTALKNIEHRFQEQPSPRLGRKGTRSRREPDLQRGRRTNQAELPDLIGSG